MNLEDYVGLKVEIIDVDGQVFYGVVDDHVFPNETDEEKESIVIKNHDGRLIELYPDEIKSIIIIS